jgi:hypothetical protein
MILLLACTNRVALDGQLPVDLGTVTSALFVESNFSNPPDDGSGLLLLSSGGVSCEQLAEVDAFGVSWLAEQGGFTVQQSGVLVELQWLELGWLGAYPVGGELVTDEGVRSATLYAYEDGAVYALNTDSGAVYMDVLADGGVEGRIDTRQVQSTFVTEHCGQADPVEP